MKALSVLFALQPLQNLLQAFLQNSHTVDAFSQLWFTKQESLKKLMQELMLFCTIMYIVPLIIFTGLPL